MHLNTLSRFSPTKGPFLLKSVRFSLNQAYALCGKDILCRQFVVNSQLNPTFVLPKSSLIRITETPKNVCRRSPVHVSKINRYCHSDGNSSNRYSQSIRNVGVVCVGLGAVVGMFLYGRLELWPPELEVSCEQQTLIRGTEEQSITLEEAIQKSKDFIQRIKDETGSPGLAISVGVDGQDVWSYGLGYADVENRVYCSGDTVWRIASISKPVTMAAVAKQWEAGKLDLDKPIQEYLPKFPKKQFEGKEVTITTRQLVSHLAGIRHYGKDYMKKSTVTEGDNPDKKGTEKPTEKKMTKQPVTAENFTAKSDVTSKDAVKQSDTPSSGQMKKNSEFEFKEYYLKKKYPSVTESLKLFQDDPLVHQPVFPVVWPRIRRKQKPLMRLPVKLKNKKKTKEAFCSDVLWCLEEMGKGSVSLKGNDDGSQWEKIDKGNLQTMANGDCQGEIKCDEIDANGIQMKANDDDDCQEEKIDEGGLQTMANGDCHGENENNEIHANGIQTKANDDDDCHGENENNEIDANGIQTKANDDDDCQGENENEIDANGIQTKANDDDCHGENENNEIDANGIQTKANDDDDCQGENENNGIDANGIQTKANDDDDCHGENENNEIDANGIQTNANDDDDCHWENENNEIDANGIQTKANDDDDCQGENENNGIDANGIQTKANDDDDCHGENENNEIDANGIQTKANYDDDCHGENENNGIDANGIQTKANDDDDCQGENENNGIDANGIQTKANDDDCHGENENNEIDANGIQTKANDDDDCHGENENNEIDANGIQTKANDDDDCQGENENNGIDANGIQTKANYDDDCHGENENNEIDANGIQTKANDDCHGENENNEIDANGIQTKANYDDDCHGENENNEIDANGIQTKANDDCHGENENNEIDANGIQTKANYDDDCHGENENNEIDANGIQTKANDDDDCHGENENNEIDANGIQTKANYDDDCHGENENNEIDANGIQTKANDDCHGENENNEIDANGIQTKANDDCQGEKIDGGFQMKANGDCHWENENDEIDGGLQSSRDDCEENEVNCSFSENDMSDVYEYDADSSMDSDYVPETSDEEEIEYYGLNMLNANEIDIGKEQHHNAQNTEVIDKPSTSSSKEIHSTEESTPCSESKEISGDCEMTINRKVREENRIYSRNTDIYIKEHTKSNAKSKIGRVFDRVHACLYCKKLFTNIQIHLEKHTGKPEIKDLKEAKQKARNAKREEKPTLTREVKRLQNLLRIKGDHEHNLAVMKNNEGELLLARRRKGTFVAHEYGPCPQCLEWIRLRNNYAKHRQTCSSKNRCTASVANVQQFIFQARISSEASKQLKTEVFPSMMQDVITSTAMEDALVISIGEYHFNSNIANKIRRKNYTSYRMRLVARLLNLLRKDLSLPNASFLELIKAEYFDAFIKCSIEACGVTEDEELKYPSTALKLGFDIARLAGAKTCYAIRQRNEELRNDADNFTQLVQREWKIKIKKRASTLLEERQFNRKTELPLPDDVAKLAKYLVDSLKALKLTEDSATFQRVVVLTEARLLLYNRRRPGELEAIRVSTYRKRSQGVDETDLSLRAELTKMEKTLLETQELLEIRGKCGKKVPVLLPLEVKGAMNYLADTDIREKCGIQRDNPYIFANTRDLSVRAGNALNLVKYEIDLRRPDRIMATNLRKHTATISQVMGLDDQQLKWLQRHMGHTERVHLQHYRATSGLIERIDIAKLMLLQEKNMVARFAGVRLEDISFEDLDDADREQTAGFIDKDEAAIDEDIVQADKRAQRHEDSTVAPLSNLSDSDGDHGYEKPKKKKQKSAVAPLSDLSDSEGVDGYEDYEKPKKKKQKSAGSKFLYTTHGFTLLSAVLESAAGKSFEILIKEMFSQMGLVNTFLDENDPIIYNRGRHYIKTNKGRLQNAPYVDNSYKWAGGGILSTTRDIVKFGNIMLYSYQWRPYYTNRGQEKTANDAANVQIKNNTKHVPGYLKHGTVEMLWTPVEKAKKKEDYYGMGWIVVPEMYSYGECRQDRQVLSHTGGAVGASSILVILPRDSVKSNKLVHETTQHYLGSGRLPQGVVVAIIVNMGEVNLTKTAVDVAKLFDKIR